MCPMPAETARDSSAGSLLLPCKVISAGSTPAASATSSSPPVQTSTPRPSSVTHWSTARKVAVLGPIPHDQIVTHAGERFHKYGCVIYTAAALSALLDSGDTIVPISHVRREDEGPIKQILGSFPNIDTSGITSSADQGDVVELRYIDQNRRIERQTSFMNPVLPADIDKVLDADVFVCVPITDYEVGQATLRHIKEHSG